MSYSTNAESDTPAPATTAGRYRILHRFTHFVLTTCLVATCLTGCKSPSDSRPGAGAPVNAQTFVYECDGGHTYTVRTLDDRAWLFLPGETVELPQIPAASGVKYSDGITLLWSKGDEALLERGGRQHRGCVNNRRAAIWEHAKLNGAGFRAVGNEPGWNMEIRHKTNILLVSDYGQSRYEFTGASVASDAEQRKTVYTATGGEHRIEITLIGETCRDTMADEQYETRVVIELDGRILRGCGRPLH